MTLEEYAYRMKAYALSRVDKEYDMHMQAWLNVQAGSTEQKGNETKPKYKNFKEFFDYKKKIEEIETPKQNNLNNRHKRMAQIAATLNK